MNEDALGDYLAHLAPTPQTPPKEEEPESWTPVRHFGDEANGLVDDGEQPAVFGERVAPQTFDLDIVAVRHCRYPCDIPWHRH